MQRKWIYLGLGLLLPILLTLFLKFFGKSEFNIPVYYTDEVKSPCQGNYEAPYLIADSVLAKWGTANRVSLVTIDSSAEASKNFERLHTELTSADFNFVRLENEPLNNQLLECVLLVQKPWTTVLIDGQRRVRGYYAPSTREEGDRLIVEMKILLKQY